MQERLSRHVEGMSRLSSPVESQAAEAIAKRGQQVQNGLVALMQAAPIAPGQQNAIGGGTGLHNVFVIVGTDGVGNGFENLGRRGIVGTDGVGNGFENLGRRGAVGK